MIADQVGGNPEVVPQDNVAVPQINTPDNSEQERLKAKLNLANQHARKAEKEREELQSKLETLAAELNSLKSQTEQKNQQSLEDQGAFKELYESEKGRARKLEERLLNETGELRRELESVTQSAKQERLKASAMSQISRSNAVNPQQLYMLLQPALRTDEQGSPVVLNEGVEQPLGDYLSNLKQAADWQHHFTASRQHGMGITPGTGSVAPGRENPYQSGNLTEAIRLEVENPELARALKSEANRI